MTHRPPGLLRARMDADLSMMICTAGHVDHGKTRLVKLLTGCNTDRLKEEQERGLTIELGFAPCLLKGEICVGIVDVPGHEKFVRNMVAGVSGIDLAVLVIAADDGVMPQTIEHLEIMELVGVRRGMVALTKIDLVAPERVEEVTAEIAEFLAGSFLDGARICPVSSETLEGFDGFYEGLVAAAGSLTRRRSDHIFRMPVLNSFSSEGFGNVVTGIPVEGEIEIGTQVELVPGGHRGKVRGLQRFLRDATEGGYGQCLAVNVPEFGKLRPERGQVLSLPGYLEPASSFDLLVRTVAGIDRPLRNAEEMVFHTGTSETRGKLYLLEEKTLSAETVALATIVLASPVVAAVHDKYIIRRSSPARTVAGGEICGVRGEARRSKGKRAASRVRAFLDFFSGIDRSSEERLTREIEFFLLGEGVAAVTLSVMARGALITEAVAEERLGQLVEEGRVLKISSDLYLHAERYRWCRDQITERVKETVERGDQLKLSITDLRKGYDWAPPLWNRIQEELEGEELISRSGDQYVLRGAVREVDDGLEEGDRRLVKKLLELYRESGFSSPRPGELPDLLRTSPAKIEHLLGLLVVREELFRLSKNVVLAREWLAKAEDIVVEIIGESGVLDSGDFKGHIGSTRKYALAILDYLDTRMVTVRMGNIRRLTGNYRKNMLPR
jgi:selenocysteine-specific elongation factor